MTHLPVWMTETTGAAPATLLASPWASVDGLVALRRLLDGVLDPMPLEADRRGRP
ncbi:hypothetical protein [Gemmatimonas sp.]|uniref:hypothetical protein n=1 Tax=Gemmatimonas sp. TaxID=1962908 RepID=UPI003563C229